MFSQFSQCVERASIDEAYIDITRDVETRLEMMKGSKLSGNELKSTYIVGWEKSNSATDDLSEGKFHFNPKSAERVLLCIFKEGHQR